MSKGFSFTGLMDLGTLDALKKAKAKMKENAPQAPGQHNEFTVKETEVVISSNPATDSNNKI
ncbi:MAG: hypothetical protein EBU52_14170 [Cytophagia bacterium]|nr:hypothetical protein [Cytophagia bacterium]